MDISSRRLRTIVVGSALDGQSAEVLHVAAALARASGARLIVVHAVSPLALAAPLLGGDPEVIARSRSALAAEAERVLEAGDGRPELRVEAELPDRLIASVATDQGADLLVVGATSAQGQLGKLLGSTAEHLLHAQAFPVLVVRGPLRVPARRVLAPVDLSLLSRDAFRCGLRILAGLGVGGVDVEGLLVTPAGQGARAGELEDFLAASAIAGVRLLGRALGGDPAPAVLGEAARTGCDLILIGTRGQGGLRRRLGSVTAEVVRRAPCSVLVVPPAAALGEAMAEAVEEELAPQTRAW